MSKGLSAAKGLLAVPESFIATARTFPEKVEQALALLDNVPDVAELLAKADTLEHYARRIKVDTETINHIQYGKVLIVDKLGGLMERTKGGRGKKNHSSGFNSFSPQTAVTYRKVHDHSDKLPEYREKIIAAKDEDNPPEISIAGFIRYVSSDGNLKAHQNKGVIEWYTPAEYIEAARAAMGSIDLDPASNAKAQKVVKAGKFYTRSDSGLDKDWSGTVFINPPFKADLIKAFVSKLCQSHKSGDVPQAVLLTNNSTDTGWWHEAAELSAAICFTKGRIAFYSPAGETAAPTNGHTLFYMGKRKAAFIKAFSLFGFIMESAK